MYGSKIRLDPTGIAFPMAGGLVLHSDLGTTVLEGRAVRTLADLLLPLLDGTRERSAIIGMITEELRPSAEMLLDLLARQGLLANGFDEGTRISQAHRPGQHRFMQMWATQPEEALSRLRAADILLVGLEPWGRVAVRELASAGIGALHILDDALVAGADGPSGWPSDTTGQGQQRAQVVARDLAVTAPWCRVTVGPLVPDRDSLLIPSPRRWDLVLMALAPDDIARQMRVARFAHEHGLRSLTGTLQGVEAHIGPLVVPGETACWNCCRLRILANADHPQAAQALQAALFAAPAAPSTSADLGPMASLVGHLLALEVLKIVSGYAVDQLRGQLFVQHMISLNTTRHPIIPLPWCPVCGGAAAMQQDERQVLITDTPEALRTSLAGWIDPRTGVIAHLVLRPRESDEPHGSLCANALLSAYVEDGTDPVTLEDAGGKGLTVTEALTGAVGEALERYAASRVRLADLHHAPLGDLTGDRLDPRQLCLYEEKQYSRPGFPFVPFDAVRPHWWVQGRWLDTGEAVWVPALPAYYRFPQGAEDPFCQVTSSGLAAGRDFADAALRATFELIERDAFMLHWRSRRPACRLAIDKRVSPEIRSLIRQLEECGARIELYLLDVGVPIPTVICLAWGDGQRWPGVTVSSAAHLSPRTAAYKAVLEQAYSGVALRRLLLNGKRPLPTSPEQITTFLDHALFYLPQHRAAACEFLRSNIAAPISLGSLREPETISLEACAERLSNSGIRVAIVDVTAPDVARSPFRVVRALSTCLQPLSCGFGLERIANPRLRAQLIGAGNPDPHPLC